MSPDKLFHDHPIQPSDKELVYSFFPLQVTCWRTCRPGFWIGVSTCNVHSKPALQDEILGVELA